LEYGGTFAGGGAITRTGQPQLIREGSDVRAAFVRRKNFVESGLTYTVEFSANLSGWEASTATPTVLADDGTLQIATVPYPAFVGGLKTQFFRLRVNLAP
jgi:hypothetical protein